MPIRLLTSGGGTTTIQPTTSASSVTLTIPSVNANVVTTGDTASVTQAMLGSGLAGTGPAFSVYRNSAQNATTGTYTKINFEIEEFDTASCYDNSTNYRFTPNVSGYYLITVQVNVSYTSAIASTLIAAIYKNGSVVARNYVTCASVVNTYGSSVTKLIYLNGSTDFIEGYVYQNNGGDRAIATGVSTYMTGFLARAA